MNNTDLFLSFSIGIILGSIISFVILVPKVKEYQKSIVCRNGEIVQKKVQENYITFERIDGTMCEPKDTK